MNKPVLECKDLSRVFTDGQLHTEVLQKVNLTLHAGECIAIIGSSGSGKSTLLHLLGGLDKPSTGVVQLLGQNLQIISEKQRSSLRNKNLGFVYQFHHLLPEFNALENVAMPLLIRGMNSQQAINQATEILNAVGLSARLQHKPSELSGGERQRTAIARAAVTKPQCILADEPTGNLDRKTANQVFQMLLDLNSQTNASLIIVTHDQQLAQMMDHIYHLEDGYLQHASSA